jgi:hypothetical protein
VRSGGEGLLEVAQLGANRSQVARRDIGDLACQPAPLEFPGVREPFLGGAQLLAQLFGATHTVTQFGVQLHAAKQQRAAVRHVAHE